MLGMSSEEYKQNYTDIKDLYTKSNEFIGKIIIVKGWVKFFRTSGGKGKSIAFARLSDGSCTQTLQIIYDIKSLPDDKKTYFDDILKRGKRGISISTTGLIVKSPKAEQPIEMQAHEYEIFGDLMDPDTYPISKNELTLEYLRTIPHLRTKDDVFSAIMRVKSAMRFAVANYFNKYGFFEVQVPCITDNECESGANPFQVTTTTSDSKISTIPTKSDDKDSIDFFKDFFRKRVYLTVSGQLHLEAMALALSKVWTMTTAFRAEPSMTQLHMGEFWMLELEFCFGTLKDNIKVNEECIKYCIKHVLENCKSELELFQSKFNPKLIEKLQKYADTPFVITTHEECVKSMLADIESGKVKIDSNKKFGDDIHVFKEIPKYDDDFTKDHEKYITGVLHGGMPVFVCWYPAQIKAFYMPKINKGEPIEKVDNFDLLFENIGEVAGGSQRETNHTELISRMHEMGIKPETLEFYSDLRKYGTVPHGGSGIGFDRLMLVITGLNNIRDMIPFPRAYQECLF